MRRLVLPLLLAVNAALLLWLASLWFTPDGRLAGVAWQPPSPLKPVLDGDEALAGMGVELGRYVATLDRPLFSPSRRPPPPPAEPVANAPVLSEQPPDLRLLGLYGTGGEGAGPGGVVARIDGQVRRIRLGDSIGRWTLKELRPDAAVLAAGDVQHVYSLQRAPGAGPSAAQSADNAAPSPAPAAARAPGVDPIRQRQIEEARANVRRVNALRARSGLPPVPEP